MRPLVGGDALPVQPRKQSFADPEATTPTVLPGNGAPTTFFMATESMMETSTPASTSTAGAGSGSESNFGIRSLDSTLNGGDADNEADGSEDTHSLHGARRRSTLKASTRGIQAQTSSTAELASTSTSPGASPARRQQRHPSPEATSQAPTPSSYQSPVPSSSMPSSPKSTSTRSLRLSDDESGDDGASQAIISSGDEDADPVSGVQGTPPQLIMPSIIMPSRRPFTTRGKSMGRLKVLIAGASGVGKTSLIKSIVQLCEDIVHVDPILPSSPSLRTRSTKGSRSNPNGSHSNSTSHILEVYASTKAYPSWWSDFEESKLLRRRKSGGETVLERNICFVDTPGYDCGTSVLEGMDSVLQYIEAQMAKNTSFATMSDIDLLNMLGGCGGFQVDVVLFLLTKDLHQTDIEFMARLSQTTNVIPLVAKVDTLIDNTVERLKKTISETLTTSGIKPFVFTSEQPDTLPSYTVCSSPSNDDDNMDASLLMSPDYVQPLLPSDLSSLVEQLFDNDNASWLRHAAAKKVIQWRKTPRAISIITPTSRISFAPQYNRATTSPLTVSTTANSPASPIVSSFPNSPVSFAHARIADHTQREERLAQIHLANWAGNLQRSLQNERSRYEILAQEQRKEWLAERLEECKMGDSMISSSQIMTLATKPADAATIHKDPSTRYSYHRGLMNAADPLGLMRWNEVLKRRGWLAFQIVGGFGVLGAVAVWVVRNWGMGMGYDSSASWNWGWFGAGA